LTKIGAARGPNHHRSTGKGTARYRSDDLRCGFRTRSNRGYDLGKNLTETSRGFGVEPAGSGSVRIDGRPDGGADAGLSLPRLPTIGPIGAQEAVPTVQPATESTFLGAGGVRLFRRSWRPTGPYRGTLVLVHGLKDHSARYGSMAQELVDRGYAVEAFDLPGHGRSEGRRAYVRSFDDLVADLDRFVATIRESPHPGPIFLFGHSLGGALVALFTITRDPSVAGVVLSAPALKVTDDVSPRLIRTTRFLGRWLPGLRVLKAPDELFSRDPAVVQSMKQDPLIEHKPMPARTAAQLLLAMEGVANGRTRFRPPLLAMHGTGDRLTNPEGSRELVAEAVSPDKTLRLWPGLYHDLVHEPERAEVVAAVVAWVESHTPPAIS
jgi:acylglycerol lipase